MSTVRIAFLLPHLRPGGAERVVLNWLGALDRRRFTPLLFLTRIEGAFLDSLPADIAPVALGGGRALRLPRRIARALADHDVDIAYSATNAMNLALLAARTAVPRIVSEHTPPTAYLAEAKLPLLRRAAMRLFYPRAAAVAVPTQTIAAELGHLFGPVRTQCLPNPVVAHVARTLPVREPAGALRIVSAGRLVAAKGFDTLIDAAGLAVATGVDLRLTIHGEGPLRDALRARIDAAGLAAIVTLAGHADDLSARMAAADLFVLASRREGFGNVLVEAMAVGTPVLATRAGGPQTFLTDGRDAHLAPPDDPAALAAALVRLARDPAMRDAVRGPALATAAGYTVDHATRVFETLVDTLVVAAPRTRSRSA